ncbi:MAG: hypothetical protein AB1635_21770 [Acidobacteriota bacterium]
MSRPLIAVASPLPGERSACLQWLESGGYVVLPLLSLNDLARDLERYPFEALVADADLVFSRGLLRVMRDLTINRPLMVIGPEGPGRAEVEIRGSSYLARPLAREMLMLSLALSLAEGRPARRSPRRVVPRLPALIDGVPAFMLDVSYEGMRLEIPGPRRLTLPPQFTVSLPLFNLAVTAKRVWVNGATPSTDAGAMQCGAAISVEQPGRAAAWRALVESQRSGAARIDLTEVSYF